MSLANAITHGEKNNIKPNINDDLKEKNLLNPMTINIITNDRATVFRKFIW